LFAESQDYGSHGERVRNACWGYLCQSATLELREVRTKQHSGRSCDWKAVLIKYFVEVEILVMPAFSMVYTYQIFCLSRNLGYASFQYGLYQ
jgi:hypothetical protein